MTCVSASNLGTQATLEPAALRAQQIWHGRRSRDNIFAGYQDGFGEPAWDALLLLFVEEAKGKNSVSSRELIDSTTMREEIAKPYQLWLASQDLVRIAGDDVSLTERGRVLMKKYLDQEMATMA